MLLKINLLYSKSIPYKLGPNTLTHFLWICVRCLLVTGACISLPVNMGEKNGGVLWCSSVIIFGSCCNCGLWLIQIKLVPFSLIMSHLEEGKHHHKVLLF